MTAEAWVAVAIFVLTQFGALGATVFLLKGDTRLLREQMVDLRDSVRSFQSVTTTVAIHGTVLETMQKEKLLEGQRVDDLERRLNRFVDIRAYPVLAAERDGG